MERRRYLFSSTSNMVVWLWWCIWLLLLSLRAFVTEFRSSQSTELVKWLRGITTGGDCRVGSDIFGTTFGVYSTRLFLIEDSFLESLRFGNGLDRFARHHWAVDSSRLNSSANGEDNSLRGTRGPLQVGQVMLESLWELLVRFMACLSRQFQWKIWKHNNRTQISELKFWLHKLQTGW